MKILYFALLAYFVATSSTYEFKSSKSQISNRNDLVLRKNYIDEISEYLISKTSKDRKLSKFERSIEDLENSDELVNHNFKIAHKRSRSIKKLKSLSHNGYSLDMNVESFKSLRYCYFNEVCKNRYKPYFECVCPKSTLCTGQGGLFEGTCSNHLMPYVWIQSVDENELNRYRF